MKSIKKYIPNCLTSLRIICTPMIIYLGLTNHYWLLIVVVGIISFTDFLDGFLARKWKVTSAFGAKLDTVADKTLAISLLILLVIKNHAYFYLLLLECVIACINLYFYFKKGVVASLLIGKIKTWAIFLTILFGFLAMIIPWIPVQIFIIITFILQILTLCCYLYYKGRTKEEIQKERDKERKEFNELVGPITQNEEFQKRKKYPHHIHESVYEHVSKVAFDCYKIGKRFSLDYKSLAVAGMLHDFYEKPWQYDKERKKFFQKHAFTHAKNAILNAKKVFGNEVVTPKVEEIMLTHMFPVNKRIPRSKEAWLITLVDKADSIEFVMHPIALAKIFLKIGDPENLEEIEEKKKKKEKNKKVKKCKKVC